LKDSTLVGGIPLHGLDQIGDQIVTPAKLDIGLTPRLVHEIALADEAIERKHCPAGKQPDNGYERQHDYNSCHVSALPESWWR
jgi:hypothetical protein